MIKKIITFFDKLEDKVRHRLSHYPILYAFIGAVGIILMWKGVEETAGYVPALYGPGSVLLGLVILLMSGLLVSFFIGDSILISGFKREKKFTERTEKEILEAQTSSTDILAAEIRHIHNDLEDIKKEIAEGGEKKV